MSARSTKRHRVKVAANGGLSKPKLGKGKGKGKDKAKGVTQKSKKKQGGAAAAVQSYYSDSDSSGEEVSDSGGFEEDETVAEKDFLALGALKELSAKAKAALSSSQSSRKTGKAGSDDSGDDDEDTSGVVYLGHIPHGFYEAQMRGFFSQFGGVKRLRLARSKKSGRSKHYAFIQFEDGDEVAAVVADTMNGYILDGRTLVCHTIPSASVHDRMFAGCHRKFQKIPWRTIARRRHNGDRDPAVRKKKISQLMKKEARTRQKLAALGMDYDFPGYAGVVQAVRDSRTKGKSSSSGTGAGAGAGAGSQKAPKKQKQKKQARGKRSRSVDSNGAAAATPKASSGSGNKTKKAAAAEATPTSATTTPASSKAASAAKTSRKSHKKKRQRR